MERFIGSLLAVAFMGENVDALLWLLLALAWIGAMFALIYFPNVKGWGSRLEIKLNLIMKHLGIAEPWQLSDRVKELAKNPANKIKAIAAYREETGKSLNEAKDAVEFWISMQAV